MLNRLRSNLVFIESYSFKIAFSPRSTFSINDLLDSNYFEMRFGLFSDVLSLFKFNRTKASIVLELYLNMPSTANMIARINIRRGARTL